MDEVDQPFRKLLVRPPSRVTRTTDTNSLQHTTSAKLAQNLRRSEFPGLLRLVWLDTPDVVHIGHAQRLHEIIQGRLEDRRLRWLLHDGAWTLGATSRGGHQGLPAGVRNDRLPTRARIGGYGCRRGCLWRFRGSECGIENLLQERVARRRE